MVQGASNKPKTKENQWLNPWDKTTLTAFLKDLNANPKIEMDDLEKPLTYPTFLFDPQSNPMKAFGSANPMPIIANVASLANGAIYSANTLTDIGSAVLGLQVLAQMMVVNKASGAEEVIRTPTWWANALITANGSTAIHTSAATKKTRILGWRVTLISGTTAAAASAVRLYDVAADTGIGVDICGAALGAAPASLLLANETWLNGYKCAAVNTALNVFLTSALAVAGVSVQVWGTEE